MVPVSLSAVLLGQVVMISKLMAARGTSGLLLCGELCLSRLLFSKWVYLGYLRLYLKKYVSGILRNKIEWPISYFEVNSVFDFTCIFGVKFSFSCEIHWEARQCWSLRGARISRGPAVKATSSCTRVKKSV